MRAVRLLALVSGLIAPPAFGQGWELRTPEGALGPEARACADEAGHCLALGCTDGGVLRWWLDLPEAAQGSRAVQVEVDGRAAGALAFARLDETAPRYVAPFHPEDDAELIARLKAGSGARLTLSPDEAPLALSLRGSSRSLAGVLEACPQPVLPTADPEARVLGEITAACARLGGEVSVEPGFVRAEDLDGDGRGDIVLDHAAAVCSALASLGCSSGGCTVSFWLARDPGYMGVFSGMIRGYAVEPGGILALDLHGTACGVFGFEPCRKRYDVTGDELRLVETLTGAAALAAIEGGAAAGAPPEELAAEPAPLAPPAPLPVVVRQAPPPAPVPPLPAVPPLPPHLEWLGDGGPILAEPPVLPEGDSLPADLPASGMEAAE